MFGVLVRSLLVLVCVTSAVHGYQCEVGTFKTQFCEAVLVFKGRVDELVSFDDDAIYRVTAIEFYKQAPGDMLLPDLSVYTLVVDSAAFWHQPLNTEETYLFDGSRTGKEIHTKPCGIFDRFGESLNNLEEYQMNILNSWPLSITKDEVCDGCTIERYGANEKKPKEVCIYDGQNLWQQDCFRGESGSCEWN